MANYSTFECFFHGDKEKINRLHKELVDHTEDSNFFYPYQDNCNLDLYGFSSASIDMFSKMVDDLGSQGTIAFHGNGRWHGPYSAIEYLCNKHGVDCDYYDAESGCDFFHEMHFKRGKKEKEIETHYISRESVAHFGSLDLLEEYAWMGDEEHWRNKYSDIIDKFIQAGISKETILSYLGGE